MARQGYTLAFGWSIDDFVKSLTKRGREPGTFNHYVSMDTQVLAMVLKRATNSTTLTSYLESRMWSKVCLPHALLSLSLSRSLSCALFLTPRIDANARRPHPD